MSSSGNTPSEIEAMRKAFNDFESIEEKQKQLLLQKEHTENALQTLLQIISNPYVSEKIKVEPRSLLRKLNS